MAAAGFAACMGAPPETVLQVSPAPGFHVCLITNPLHQAAEIGIEHNLGLTCDPIDGLVQVPCIVSHGPAPWTAPSLLTRLTLAGFAVMQERNSLGAVKAVTAAQLAMASDNVYRVSLDQAIEAMRLTAADMSVKYKETSLSVRPSYHSLGLWYRSLLYPFASRDPAY
jgi:L-serine deaminase